MTRREFLVRSTVIAGSGFFSIGMPGLLSGTNAEAAMARQAFTPAIWFTITPDGKTTMHIVKAEMGQHIGTGLAQVIAEELEVDWADVRLDAPLESVENFGVYGLAYTVNSGSVTTEFDRIARAGAAGRIALVEAGAACSKPIWRTVTPRIGAGDRQGLRPIGGLRRDPAEGENRSQVRLTRTISRPSR